MNDIAEELAQVLELVPPPPPFTAIASRAGQRRRVRRMRQATALAAVVAIVVASAVAVDRVHNRSALSLRIGSTPPSSPPSVRFDSPIGDDGPLPFDIAYGDGSVWIRRDGDVERIDPSGRVVARIAVPGEGDPHSILVTPTAVWIGSSFGRLVRIDPATNRVVASLPIAAQSMVAQGGLVWVRTSVEFAAVDPRTNRIVRRFSHLNRAALAATRDDLWIINGCSCLERVDPRTLVATDVHIDAESILATSSDTVWIVTGTTTITEIDARTAKPIGQPIDVHGLEPAGTIRGRILFVGSLTNAGAGIAAYDTRTHAVLARSRPVPATVMVRVAATPAATWIIGDRLSRFPTTTD